MIAHETTEKNNKTSKTPLETGPEREMTFRIEVSTSVACKRMDVNKNLKKDPPVLNFPLTSYLTHQSIRGFQESQFFFFFSAP
jgi:hypothetical protein